MKPESTLLVIYLLGTFGCLFLAFLPWYSWFIGLFSIPVAIIDIVLVNIFKGNYNSFEPFEPYFSYK